MIVRIAHGTVAEVYPDFITTVEDVAQWYSPAYAAASAEAPEDVHPGWRYIGGEFLPPQEPEPIAPDPQQDIDAMMIDHEFRITMVELGIF